MSHLSPDTFVDLLDGSLSEESVPHLEACQSCRQQLAELRATWEAAQGFEAPEPSPLFWDHFSARVHEAVSTEPPPARAWWPFARWRMAVLAGGAGALVVAAALGPFRTNTVNSGTAAPEVAATLANQAPAAEELPEDDSLGFVADLASNINWDNSADSVLTHGDADRALDDMDAGERAELRRLLDEALGNRKI